jgi:hypothetical protein
MRKNTSFLFSLFVLFVFAGAAAAQSPDKILKQAAKALGGEKALKAISSTRVKGKITRLSDGSDGNYLAQVSTPNLYYSLYDLNGFETAAGFNGKSAWQRDSREGSRTLTGDAGRNFQAEASFHAARWLTYKAEKAKLTPAGSKIIYGKNCSGVYLTTFKGVKIGLYFDAVSGLPVREEFPNGETVRTLDYEDFRKVDSVMEPFRIIMSIGEEKYDIKLEEISHNQKISRADFDFPNLSSEPLPDIPKLLKEVQANQDRLEKLLEEYTFTETVLVKELGKDGRMNEIDFGTSQITFYKGQRIYRQIEKNGKPLSPSEQEKEDKRVAEEVADLEKKVSRREEKAKAGDSAEDGKDTSLAEILRASNLINSRRERFRGRDVIVFDFEPNPNYDFKNAKGVLKLFGKIAGVIWIDEKDKQVARMEAYLADSFNVGGGLLAKLNKGSSFSMEQQRVNDEIWLPSLQDINISARVLLVKGINVNQTTKYGNYKKFKTEVKDAKVDQVKDQ